MSSLPVAVAPSPRRGRLRNSGLRSWLCLPVAARSLLFAVLLLCADVAHAQQYLIFNNQSLCLARSQTMCTAMQCDGVHTIYWWDCGTGPLQAGIAGLQTVTSGSYAMRIDTSSVYFGISTSNLVSNGLQGLTTSEQTSLVSAAQLAPLLPSTSGVTP